MKCFFYYSNSCFPYSGLAAAMHLGIIPFQPPFNISELNKLPVWRLKKTKGKPLFTGTDRFGNRVYALWDAGEPGMVKRIIFSFLEIYKIPPQRAVFLDLDLKDNLLSLTAVTLTRLPITTPWGEFLIHRILNKCYPAIAGAVDRSNAQNLTKTANYQIMLP